MKKLFVGLLLCLCLTTQTIACGVEDHKDEFEVLVLKRTENISQKCTYFRIIYPKYYRKHSVSNVAFFTSDGVGSSLSVASKRDHNPSVGSMDDYYFSIVCMNEEILSKSTLIFILEKPSSEGYGRSICMPMEIKIHNLADLLVEGDEEEKEVK